MTSRQKSIIAAVLGTTLEFYDFSLYSTFVFILSPYFFPSDDPNFPRLAGMVVMAAGFFMRLPGGIFFGYLGDTKGRRTALSWSIFLMAFPTLLISILPSYKQVGLASPILLVISRLVQNFCVSGESSGAILYLVENAKKGQEAITGSLLNVGCVAGSLLGAGLGYICTLPNMPDWAWRVPFFLGSILCLVAFYIRRNIKETPAFVKSEPSVDEYSGVPHNTPLVETLKESKMALLCTIGLCSAVMVPPQILFTYMGDFLHNDLGWTPNKVMELRTIINILWLIELPIAGWLADRYGVRFIMMVGTAGISIISLPVFMYLQSSPGLASVLILQFLIAILSPLIMGPICALLVELFSVRGRYTGISVGWSLGACIFTGSSALISYLLTQSTGHPHLPGYFLTFCMVIGCIAIRMSKRLQVR